MHGFGLMAAMRTRAARSTANACYRVVHGVIANAELIDAFRFIAESEVFEFDYWRLEQCKIDSSARQSAFFVLWASATGAS